MVINTQSNIGAYFFRHRLDVSYLNLYREIVNQWCNIFSGKYGGTAQYADWISEKSGLPIFDVDHTNADPSNYDFLILGSSVIVYKLTIHKWVRSNLDKFLGKLVILFSVSGARAGEKLDGWIANCLPAELVSTMQHVASGGRMNPKELSW